MVRSTQTSGGKYLSRTWAADRADAVEHPENFAVAEIAWLEVPAGLVPAEYFLDANGRDIRDRPECGG